MSWKVVGHDGCGKRRYAPLEKRPAPAGLRPCGGRTACFFVTRSRSARLATIATPPGGRFAEGGPSGRMLERGGRLARTRRTFGS